MNKELIQERIDSIKKEMELVKASYAKLEGHLGEAMYWIITIEKCEQENSELENTLKEKLHTANNLIPSEEC